MARLEVSHVTFTYAGSEAPAITDLSFAVEHGQVCALIGANGSGKTTVCNILRGFIPSFFKGEFSGEVLLDGNDIRDEQLGALGERIGYVFQNPFVQISGATDSVFDEVAFGLENIGRDRADIPARVAETLELLELTPLRDKHPADLSGGQKQRVAFASTLAMDPDVFVIDEPTSQLDPQSTKDIFGIIMRMKKLGKTIVLVEHKAELVAEIADVVIVLEDGGIRVQGTPGAVFADPDFDWRRVGRPVYADLAHALSDTIGRELTIPVTHSAALSEFAAIVPRKDH